MATTLSGSAPVSDFRHAAFAESLSLLGAVRADQVRVDPAATRVSLCIPTPDDAGSIRRRLRRLIILHGGLGITGIAAGGAIAFWLKRSGTDDGRWLGVALACSLLGFVFLFIGLRQERWALRQIALPRIGSSLRRGSVFVHIEEAATYLNPKILSEDAGILLFHPDHRCIQIEGISARYLIYDVDVVSLEARPVIKSQAVLLTYRVGGTTLALSLKDQGIRAELQAQLLKRCPLLKKARVTLSLPVQQPAARSQWRMR